MRIVHARNSKLRKRIKSIIVTGNHPDRCVEVLSYADLSLLLLLLLLLLLRLICCQLQIHLMHTSLLDGAPSRASIKHEIKKKKDHRVALNRLHTHAHAHTLQCIAEQWQIILEGITGCKLMLKMHYFLIRNFGKNW